MKIRRSIPLVATVILSLSVRSDTVKIGSVVLDDLTTEPIPDVEVCFSFKEDIGWRAWTESSKREKMFRKTDLNGYCTASGVSNCGQGGCYVKNPPEGYYHPALGWKNIYTTKDAFGVWQPDNLVATIRLQRVEHPIPLFVKRVELRDNKNGIGGFDGTNSVLRFDLMKGEWLPPYGNGEVSDIEIGSSVKITGTGKYRKAYPEFGWTSMNFYELVSRISVSDADRIMTFVGEPNAGLKIRIAHEDLFGCSVTRSRGERQVFEKNGKDWHTENFNDLDPNRCYTFRIRSRRDEDGKLVEAYYGKIYGDFEFEGDDKKGLIGVKFLYYLNPKSLDRNLEWDMKNNLCPNPGNLNQRFP